VPKDYVAAFNWISKAAQQGLDKAQYNLGKMYRDGQGAQADAKAAAEWFLKAAEQGHAKSQTHIGTRLMRGQGIAKDEARALMFLILGAQGGDYPAKKAAKVYSEQLPPETVKEAEKLAKEWKPKGKAG
jgi:TPR repeat protein